MNDNSEKLTKDNSMDDNSDEHLVQLAKDNNNRQINSKRVFDCTICESKFTQRYHLKRHTDEVHSNTKSFRCPICRRKFKRLEHLKKHISMHLNKNITKACPICKCMFKRRETLMQHVFGHFEKKISKNTENANTEKLHEQIAPKERKKIVINCFYCERTFKSKHQLERHLYNVHLSKNLYECSICKDKSIRSDQFKKHVDNHWKDMIESNVEKSIEQNSLKKYNMRERFNKESFRCLKCNHVITSVSLEDKVIQKNLIQQYLECKICNLEIANNENIQCTKCEYTCDKSNEMNKHMKIHSMENLFECLICRYKFRQNSSLIRHMIIHADENTND